ncbi:MAG: molybdenum cofactor biosynthesis protein MoaE [Acidimicrobiales bacterium]
MDGAVDGRSGAPPVAGLLLTGGASRRMGRDKATLPMGGQSMAERLGRLLSAVGGPVLEVGPGHSGLPVVRDEPAGQGPLAAVAAGARALGELGWRGPAVVLACDLRRLTAEALALLAGWPGEGAVVPEVDGRRQPLCARWSPADLSAAVVAADAGRRAVGDLPAVPPGTALTPELWAPADRWVFADADRPDDLWPDDDPAATGGPVDDDVRVALSDRPIDEGALAAWVRQPRCGAVVTFAGCVRDHSEGRPGVVSLEYEAYEEPARRRLREVAAAARNRWPSLGRVAIVHRVGMLEVGDDAVVVAVAGPHRDEAFEAARFCIDTVKATVPIWKHERWSEGEGWGLCDHQLDEAPR